MRCLILAIVAMALPLAMNAQDVKTEIRKGNRLYEKKDYKNAELEYRRAFLKDSTSVAARYNLANTMYRMENTAEAESLLLPLADSMKGNPAGADYYHNLANFFLKDKKYREAVDNFKNSLRLRPDDMETKTNLAYAQKMLKEQENQQNQQNQNQNQDQNQQNQDQNKDQDKNQDKNQNQDQNKDQNNQNDQQNPNQNQQNQNNDQQDQNKDQQGQNQDSRSDYKITPQTAQQIFNAMEAKEKKTQDKVKKEKAKALKSKQKEKNW